VAGFLKQIVFLVILLVSWPVNVPVWAAQDAAGNPAVEYKIKAAFLLNFAKFITWPDQTFAGEEDPFTFCVLGRDPFGTALTPLQARSVAGHPIRVRYLREAAQAGCCQMLFVADSEQDHLAERFAELNTMPIVTVSDIPGFADRGGIIEFVTRQGRLSFRINLAEARKRHLRINASLLNLATEVIR
jgi:hypothetical protein